jgi:hypothetical protein
MRHQNMARQVHKVLGVVYTSKGTAWKAFKKALLSLEKGTIIGPLHELFPLLLQHPEAQTKLYTENKALRTIVIEPNAKIWLHAKNEAKQDFSARECIYQTNKTSSKRQYSVNEQLKNACRTAVADWIQQWKNAQSASNCYHCQCSLQGEQWEADHVNTTFADIARQWLNSNHAVPETEPNPLNFGHFHFRFADKRIAANFLSFHAAQVNHDTGLVVSCVTCNQERKASRHCSSITSQLPRGAEPRTSPAMKELTS